MLNESVQTQNLDRPLADFLGHLRTISKTVSIAIPAINKWRSDELKKLSEISDQLSSELENEATATPELHSRIIGFNRKFSDFQSIDHRSIIVESAFTQLFSKFDAFTGDLLHTIYQKNSDLFLSSKKSITLEEVKKFTTTEELLHNELLLEIENLRRNSYQDQFITLEGKFGLKLREFSEWPHFIEASQRRNLIIHNNGIVNSQYLTICSGVGNNDSSLKEALRGCKPGDKLSISITYFREALRLVKNVAFMLTHTLWRKLFKREADKSHEACNLVIFDYLCREEWHVAASFGTFSLTPNMCDGIGEVSLKIRTINYAIALKFSKKQEECEKLLKSVDWTSANRDFRLAVAILTDKKEIALDLMRKIGKEGDLITEVAYRSWPLFFLLKEDPEFISTFEEIYQKKFLPEVVDMSVGDTSQTPTGASSTTPGTVQGVAKPDEVGDNLDGEGDSPANPT